MYIDTHAHLNFKAFNEDYPQAVERAFQAKVGGIINVGSNLKTSKKAIVIAGKYPKGVYAAVGLHPIHVRDENFDEEIFEKLARHKKVVALGETGLDYYYDRKSAELQKEVFRKILKLAGKINKPVILHSRDAGEDVLSVLMEEKTEMRGVMHCFQENWNFAKVILDMGLYLSFTGLITFTKNSNTYAVLREVPLDRLLIETDCPFMTPAFAKASAGKPESHLGKRNEPANVIEVAKKIAEIKKIPLSKVAQQTTKNARELFKLKL